MNQNEMGATTKVVSPEIDTTKVVNIWSRKFVWYVNKQPIELEPGEEKIKPVYVAQLLAKHLIDAILQDDPYNLKDTNRDTDLRRSLFAKVLPDMAEDRNIKPLTHQEEMESMKKELQRQKELIEGLSGKSEERDEIKKLKDEIKMLKARMGRKVASQEQPTE